MSDDAIQSLGDKKKKKCTWARADFKSILWFRLSKSPLRSVPSAWTGSIHPLLQNTQTGSSLLSKNGEIASIYCINPNHKLTSECDFQLPAPVSTPTYLTHSHHPDLVGVFCHQRCAAVLNHACGWTLVRTLPLWQSQDGQGRRDEAERATLEDG